MRFGWIKSLALATGLLSVMGLAACDRKPSAQELAKASAEADSFLAKNAKEQGVVTTASGLQYKVEKAGDPKGPKPGLNTEVKVHYEGKLLNGTVFDSSYERGVPAVFTPASLVPAWQEALPMMRPGDVWTLYVPPKLGYGEAGTGPIPPNAVLVFKLELVAVKS